MLTQAQRERFETEGYLVLEDVVTPTTMAALRQEYADLMDKLYGVWAAEGLVPRPTPGMGPWEKFDHAYKAGFDWYQPFDISLPHDGITEETPMHIGPAVFDLIRDKGILDVVESLIGPELTSNPIQHVRIKPPESAVSKDEVRAHVVSTDWHQDRGVTLAEADQTEMITVWVAVTDATVENGCLQVIPGREPEMIPHCLKTQTGIVERLLPDRPAVPAPVRAGGIVIFHPLTPHASLSNRTDGYRWSFDLRYNVTGQPTGRSQFPDFVVRSASDPGKELKDWKEWKAMWDATRTHLANSAHIPQHRWPSDGPYCA